MALSQTVICSVKRDFQEHWVLGQHCRLAKHVEYVSDMNGGCHYSYLLIWIPSLLGSV